MKKISLFIIAAIFILGSCGSSTENEQKKETEQQITDEKQETTEKQQKTETTMDETAKILCPYCLSEITEETTICEHCGLDTRNDAPFEMTDEEIKELEMVSCKSCGKSIPKMAHTCRYCKKKTK